MDTLTGEGIKNPSISSWVENRKDTTRVVASIWIEKTVINVLDDLADDDEFEGSSRSEIVRDAVAEYLEDTGVVAE